MAYIGQRPVIGRYIKLDQISSGFNGSNTGFSMTAGSQAVFPGTARNLLLSLGGVIQEPDTDFTISGSTLTFTTPPVANTTFFGIIYGDMQATGTPSDGTVLPASIASSGNFSFPQVTVTSNLTISSDAPKIFLTDTGDDDDFEIRNDDGTFTIRNSTDGNDMISVASNNTTTFTGNCDFLAGIDVTGAITGTADMTIDTDTLHVDSSNNRVGIGVTNPASKLSVVDDSGIAIEATTGGANGKLTIIGKNTSGQVSAITRIESKPESSSNAATSTLFLNRDSSNAVNTHMTITSAGRVGIGTTGPDHLLHVQNDSVTTTKITVESTGTDSYPAFRVKNDARSYDLGINGATDSFRIFDVTANSQRLTLDSTGRFGINAAGTKGMLEVRASGGAADQLTALFGANEGTTAGTLSNNADKACRIGIQHYQTAEEPYAFLVGSAGSSSNSLSFGGSTSLMNAATLIRFYTAADTTTVTGTERMRITSGGVVQIGGDTADNADIDTSNSKLTIKQSANSKEDGIYIERSGERRGFYIYVGGALSTSDSLSITTNQLGGDTELMAIDRGGDIVVANNIKINTSGKGIDFSATANSGTSELFDDYEEGTWTATLGPASSEFTPTANTNTCTYTKVGRQVTVVGIAKMTTPSNLNSYANDSINHALKVSGLPYTIANAINGRSTATLGVGGDIQFPNGVLASHGSENGTHFVIFVNKSNGGTRTSPTINTSTQMNFHFSYTYFI